MIVSEARTRPLKELVRRIFLETLQEVDVRRAFEKKLHRCGKWLSFGAEAIALDAVARIRVVSFGKAAWPSLKALLELLGEDYRPEGGVVVSNVPAGAVPSRFLAFEAGHPIPDVNSVRAADAILELLRESDDKTLVFFLISGGGSALMERPLDPKVSLEDIQALNRLLVGCGASIDEINAIRKHLSGVKGGRLAEAASRAHKVTLLISDVPEGKLATIASGPTLPDPSTIETCYEVAARYGLQDKFPAAIRALFTEKKLRETPKEGAEAFGRAQTFLLLSSHDVLHAAHRAAGAHGFLAECDMTPDDWELPRAADYLLRRLQEMQEQYPGQPACLISGGEISCPVAGDGVGGRNQAFVLHCVERIAGRPASATATAGRDWCVLSAGTDGIDGNSPAAGAVADGETLSRARGMGLDPDGFFRRSDSFSFFDALGDAILTGPLQNNLRDLRLLLAR